MVKVIKIAGMDSYIAKFTPEEVSDTSNEEVNADTNNRSVEVVTKTKKSTKK